MFGGETSRAELDIVVADIERTTFAEDVNGNTISIRAVRTGEQGRVERTKLVKRLLLSMRQTNFEYEGCISFPLQQWLQLLHNRMTVVVDDPDYYGLDIRRIELLLNVSCEILAIWGESRRDEATIREETHDLCFARIVQRIYRRRVMENQQLLRHIYTAGCLQTVASLICLAMWYILPFPCRACEALKIVDELPPEVFLALPLTHVLCPNRSVLNDQHCDPKVTQNKNLERREIHRMRRHIEVERSFDRLNFQVSNLSRLGKLKIQWHDGLDDHLVIRSHGENEVLLVFWPGDTICVQMYGWMR